MLRSGFVACLIKFDYRPDLRICDQIYTSSLQCLSKHGVFSDDSFSDGVFIGPSDHTLDCAHFVHTLKLITPVLKNWCNIMRFYMFNKAKKEEFHLMLSQYLNDIGDVCPCAVLSSCLHYLCITTYLMKSIIALKYRLFFLSVVYIPPVE